MLSIILTVLKAIGILLLILLGIFLVLLCAFLFVPARYRITASKKEEIKAKVNLSWLFRLAYVTIRYEDSKLLTIIRIFGIPFYDSRRPKKVKKEKKHKKSSSKKRKKNTKESSDVISQDNVSEDANQIVIIEETDVDDHEKETDECEKDTTDRNKNSCKQPSKCKPSMKKRIKKIIDKIKGLPKSITNFFIKLKKIIKKWIKFLKTLIKYPGKIKEFLIAKENKSSIKLIFETVKKIVKHSKPKKIRGYLNIGLDDPCATGQLLGAISVVYAYLGIRNVKIIPDFENAVLEGEIYARGRIYSITLLRIVIRLLINEDFKGFKDRLSKIKEE